MPRTAHMTRSGRGVWILLLFCCGLLPCCGGLPNPVVLLTLKGVPGPTAQIAVEVTLAGNMTAGTVTFNRDATNKFVSGGAQSMPVMNSLSPDTVQLALDLPASLTGTVTIKALVKQPDMSGMMMMMMMMNNLVVAKTGCTKTTIDAVDLYTLPSITVADPTTSCPAS